MSEVETYQTFVRLRSTNGDWLVPDDLRARLAHDADEAGSSLSEVVIQILAHRFKVPVAAGGRRTNPSATGEIIKFDMPMSLYRVVNAAAGSHPRTVPDEIRAALCAHYGLRLPAPPPRGRRPAAA